MKVLMINPNRFLPHVSPVGLEYACNSLLRENIAFEVVDLNFEAEQAIFSKLRKGDIDLVGITVRNVDSAFLTKIVTFLPGIKKLVGRIKNERDCKVILGGAGFSIMPKEILRYTGADFGAVGYGEEILPKLVRALRAGGDLSGIENLLWRKDENLCINPLSTGDYENIPPRSRKIIRNKSYYRMYGIGNIEAKRGCVKRCGYCAEPNIVGCKVVTRKIANVIEELKELKSMGIHHVYFCDSEFNWGSFEYQSEFCEQLKKSNIGITWSANMYPDPGTMPLQLLNMMREAGCHEILLSADSGSNDLLASMGKQHTAEDTIICSENIRKANMKMAPSYLIGWPGESIETITETFNHVKRCQFESAVIWAGVRIYPNTPIARIAMKEGEINENSDFLNPLFYQPDRVLNEFIPFIRQCAKNMSNCVYPTWAVNFMNMFIQNVYLRQECKTCGFLEFAEYVNKMSLKDKAKTLGWTILDYVLPFRPSVLSS